MVKRNGRLYCQRCGFEIPADADTWKREWKRGRGRLACENCARGVVLPKDPQLDMKLKQTDIDAPAIEVK